MSDTAAGMFWFAAPNRPRPVASVAGFIGRLNVSEIEATRETPPAPLVGWMETTRGPRLDKATSTAVAATPLVSVRLASPSSEVAKLRS